MTRLMMTSIAAAILFVGAGWTAEAATWSQAAALAAAAKATEQVETVGCRSRGRCPFRWFWNGRRCVPC
jgi:hypothetical protein